MNFLSCQATTSLGKRAEEYDKELVKRHNRDSKSTLVFVSLVGAHQQQQQAGPFPVVRAVESLPLVYIVTAWTSSFSRMSSEDSRLGS